MSRSIVRTVSSASFLVLVALAWWLLAPPQLGGRTSYAVIYGVSMEPRFHSGDLVLLRQQPNYQVGEIVGYHSTKLGKPVMHRIVKYQDGRYWFKGDNNNFVDPEQPMASQLFGREWIRLPGFGSALEKLHQPRNAAILGGLAALFVLGGGSLRARRRRRRSGPGVDLPAPPAPGQALAVTQELAAVQPAATPPVQPQLQSAAPAGPEGSAEEPARPSSPDPRWVVPALAVITALGLAGVAAMSIVGIIAYTRPPTTVVTQTNLYTQRGTFGYSGVAPVGTIYDHSRLHPGDAVFANLVKRFDVNFHYGLSALASASVSGKARLDATLTDGHGWNRRLSLAPTERFSGSNTTVSGSVNVDEVMSLIRRFEDLTGDHSTAYQLLVTPHVAVHGIVGDQLVKEAFTPTLTFEVTSSRLRLAGGADGANDNTLVRTRSGTGTTTRQHSLGSLGISTARRAALIGLPASILLALIGGYLFLVARNNDEVSLIRRRYGAWIIDVAPSTRAAHVERRVESIDALARIAERYERLILHEQRERAHAFLVEDGGLVYRYDAQERTSWRLDRAQQTATTESGSPVGAAASTHPEQTEQ
jgi:signal peptidase I